MTFKWPLRPKIQFHSSNRPKHYWLTILWESIRRVLYLYLNMWRVPFWVCKVTMELFFHRFHFKLSCTVRCLCIGLVRPSSSKKFKVITYSFTPRVPCHAVKRFKINLFLLFFFLILVGVWESYVRCFIRCQWDSIWIWEFSGCYWL